MSDRHISLAELGWSEWFENQVGLRSGPHGAGGGMAGGFSGLIELSADCRYRDCRHTSETGCAVLGALESGELDRERYDNFIKLREESDYNELSHVERRKKDRDFGRYLKSAKKSIRKD